MKSVILALFLTCIAAGHSNAAPRVRDFTFIYSATVTGLEPRSVAHIWLPLPQSSPEQSVREVSRDLPAAAQEGKEPKYANAFLYFTAQANPAGSIPCRLVFHVHREEMCDKAADSTDAAQLDLFRKADAKVPVDGKPVTLLVGLSLPADELRLGRTLYDLVDDRMEYRKDKPGWGAGDAVWACDSRFGNCTDFHSLFISLARSQHLPAKFEIGFGLPEARGNGEVAGYHCWAKFKPQGRGWVPVDISEANKHPQKRDYFFGHLCENRVAFTTGRDLILNADQKGPPLNFFIYPYVEVDGKPLAADQVKKSFAYQDDN
jgi:hypothetical protein